MVSKIKRDDVRGDNQGGCPFSARLVIIIIKSDFFFQPTHLAICHVVMGEDKDGSKRR
jgi:hypothetical protein